MKKSKVIIPAMALLLFSTAASITGTVAWFTSNRVFNTSAGEFTAKSIDGNLDVTVAGGVGTTAVKDDDTVPGSTEKATKIKVNANSYLIDGSVNLNVADPVAWRLSRTAASATSDDYTSFDTKDAKKSDAADAELKWLYRTQTVSSTTTYYYVAMSWSYTFNYTFNTESTNVAIFLDLRDDVTNPTAFSAVASADGDQNATGGSNDIALGFRIGFRATDSWRVWGNNSAAATSLYYVSAANAKTAYTANQYFHEGGDGYGLASDGISSTDAAARNDYIATITKSGATGSATVNCFAWFEGTDPNVVSDTYFKTLSARMNFYARSLAA